MILDQRPLPIVLAPLAGGPSTPELAAAVSDAGGLGFLAGGYLSGESLAQAVQTTQRLTGEPFGVNLFVPGPAGDGAEVDRYAELLELEASRAGARLGEPRHDDDDWDAKLSLLAASTVPVVSFTFGFPEAEVVRRLRDGGREVWLTVTSVAEAVEARQRGADALVVQGAEAGGHRGGVSDEPSSGVGLLALLQLVRAELDLPLVAGGGIATGAGVAAVLACGADAALMGTAFLDCQEAGTSATHRAALNSGRPTALTRAFTGRTARGIRNRFIDEYSERAPAGYPEVHHLTAPLRRSARVAGDAELINLWAGEAYSLTRSMPAGELVRTLGREAQEALVRASSRTSRTPS